MTAPLRMWPAALRGAPLLACATVLAAPPRFVDATAELGLDAAVATPTSPCARVAFADLDGDRAPDLVVDRHRVFLNRADASAAHGRRLVEVPPETTGLRQPLPGTVAIFVDCDGDAILDAVTAEHCDVGNPEWIDHGRRTRWQRGRGDGTFGPSIALPGPLRTTIAIAAGDVNRDGRVDLWLGNAYVRYGASLEAWPNDLLLSDAPDPAAAEPRWTRATMPEDAAMFDEAQDRAGRPAYGVIMPTLSDLSAPCLLELGYGRRSNRLWARDGDSWIDRAPALGLDGDDIRHGRYPAWLAERAATDPRFARPDEKPFRSNGNTFDAAVGDLDGDGRFDLLLTEITHAWAGESSDRTRLLFDEGAGDARRFRPRQGWSLDRIPGASSPGSEQAADPQRWNQGDLFGAIADLDNDGRPEVIVSSGDYPDDERLRVWRNTGQGLEEVTRAWGIDHDGSQQIALADIDGDGDLDIAAGQTFNRYGPDQIAGRTPGLVVYLNEATEGRRSLVIRCVGDGRSTTRQGLGAVVEATLPDGTTRIAQIVGPGGHAGKQHDTIAHLGLGPHDRTKRVRVRWPDGSETTMDDVPAGTHVVEQTRR